MIVTVVRFRLTEPLPAADARSRFGANASRYLHTPGLLWKAYLVADDGLTAGGTYWWRDRASAEAALGPEWEAGVTRKYGAPPAIEWFEAPLVVDPVAGAVRIHPPAAHMPEGGHELLGGDGGG